VLVERPARLRVRCDGHGSRHYNMSVKLSRTIVAESRAPGE
jgi:hypothetical protein